MPVTFRQSLNSARKVGFKPGDAIDGIRRECLVSSSPEDTVVDYEWIGRDWKEGNPVVLILKRKYLEMKENDQLNPKIRYGVIDNS